MERIFELQSPNPLAPRRPCGHGHDIMTELFPHIRRDVGLPLRHTYRWRGTHV